jgi:ADP-heptose:LPS heptosyltransferase
VKSTSLGEWQPILRVPDVTFVNLQYGDCGEELAQAQSHTGFRIHHDPEVDQLREMDTFAAQVASLDLVISISNAIAHTAGALGIPTWVLLATDPLWLWFRDRDDSPWYRQARLFRQARAGDWSEPVRRAAEALEAWPSSRQ